MKTNPDCKKEKPNLKNAKETLVYENLIKKT
jgi:hypothetical protein